jgi:hypothetical protein
MQKGPERANVASAPADGFTLSGSASALDIGILAGWRALQAAQFTAVGITDDEKWVFTDGDSQTIHPHAVYETFVRIVHNAGLPSIRFHALRHTHGSLLIKDGIPVKVVSERLGHANIAFTMQTYQHILPGMQADAAKATERLTRPAPRPPTTRQNNGGTDGGTPRKPEEHHQNVKSPGR